MPRTNRTFLNFVSIFAVSVENVLVGGLAFSFRVWELFVLTIVLQIGMLLLMARDFHRITLASPMVNLVAVPLTSVMVPVGFITLASSLVFPVLGGILAAPLGWLTWLLLHFVQWSAHFPRVSYRIPGPPFWLVVVFFSVAAALAVAARMVFSVRRTTILTLCGMLAACSVIVALFPFVPVWSAGKLETTILDVGQGDSLLVVSPAGGTLLIDGGGAFGGFPEHEQHEGIDPKKKPCRRICGPGDLRRLTWSR
jgi:competence protein ComEC